MDRWDFYLTYVQEGIAQLEKQCSSTVQGLPILFSGMASSSIGIKELPYGSLPFDAGGKGIHAAHFPATDVFPHPVCLISGIRSEDDVMRGEETQLIGVLSQLGEKDVSGVFLFPGTHSKHILMEAGQVQQFKTYMTGEFFDLLSNKSILSTSVTSHQHPIHWQRFNRGVAEACSNNLLHASFSARAHHLLGKATQEENFDYLSGLLIGSELKELLHQPELPIYLCCNSSLMPRYESALSTLGLKAARVFSGVDIDKAVIRGQLIIYNQTQNQ